VTKIRWGRAALETTAPTQTRIRWGRAALEKTAAALVDPIADLVNQEPNQLLSFTATLAGGGQATIWTWRGISGPATALVAIGPKVTFTTPSDLNGTVLVLGVKATVDGVTSPEETVSITVLPQTEWFWTPPTWSPTTEVYL